MKPILYLDIETTGTDAWRDKIYMSGLWFDNIYYCCRNPRELQELLQGRFKDYDLCGHRTDFDIKFLLVNRWITEEDLKGRTIHDTRIMGSLLRRRVPKAFLKTYEDMRIEQNKSLPKGNSHRKGSPLSLKVMAPWYLKVPPFWETPGDHDNPDYNKTDLVHTAGLAKMFIPMLQEEGSWDFYVKRTLAWSEMIREMEITGIAISLPEVDTVAAEQQSIRKEKGAKLAELWNEHNEAYRKVQREKLASKYEEMMNAQLVKGKDQEKTKIHYAKLYEKACTKVEPTINYGSPAQMLWLLNDRLGLNVENYEGKKSTGKAVLNRLAQEGREDIKTFLEWRKADKILTMYLPRYLEQQVDGVLHPSFNITGTRTGRTSCSKPNLQQVPPGLYRLFKPRPGHKFVDYDLSGIEAALIALYSGDIRLYEILAKGESIHDHNAKAMFNLSCDVNEVSKLYPKERKTVKNIGFACFYGAGWRRISQVFAAGGFPISDQEAKDKLKLLKSYYPGAFEFHKEITEIFEAGETVQNLFGRPITMQADENCYMQAFNTLIQSSASDLNLEACRRAWTKNKKAKPLLVIHDFIKLEVKAEDAEESARVLEECMTQFTLNSVNGPIKLRVEGGVNDKWEK